MLRSNATRRGVPKTVPFPCEIRSTAIPVKLTSQSLRGDAARLVLEDRLARDSIWVTELSVVTNCTRKSPHIATSAWPHAFSSSLKKPSLGKPCWLTTTATWLDSLSQSSCACSSDSLPDCKGKRERELAKAPTRGSVVASRCRRRRLWLQPKSSGCSSGRQGRSETITVIKNNYSGACATISGHPPPLRLAKNHVDCASPHTGSSQSQAHIDGAVHTRASPLTLSCTAARTHRRSQHIVTTLTRDPTRTAHSRQKGPSRHAGSSMKSESWAGGVPAL